MAEIISMVGIISVAVQAPEEGLFSNRNIGQFV